MLGVLLFGCVVAGAVGVATGAFVGARWCGKVAGGGEDAFARLKKKTKNTKAHFEKFGGGGDFDDDFGGDGGGDSSSSRCVDELAAADALSLYSEPPNPETDDPSPFAPGHRVQEELSKAFDEYPHSADLVKLRAKVKHICIFDSILLTYCGTVLCTPLIFWGYSYPPITTVY